MSNAPVEAMKLRIDRMANRFLAWKLPQTFSPDCYVSFDEVKAKAGNWPTGTNLLNSDEARAMLGDVIADELMNAAMLTWVTLEATANDVANAEARAIIREFLVRSWHERVLPTIDKAVGAVA